MKLKEPAAAATRLPRPGLLAVPAMRGARQRHAADRVRRASPAGCSSRAKSSWARAAGEFFPVLEGLAEGERVVTRGGFLIDSQFQITGHPSLFYPGGLQPRRATSMGR